MYGPTSLPATGFSFLVYAVVGLALATASLVAVALRNVFGRS